MTVEIFPNNNGSIKNREWPAQTSVWSKAFEKFVWAIFKGYCSLEIHGADKFPKTPFMICSNHASHLDSAILMAASGLPFNEAGLIAAKDYFFDQSHRFWLHYLMNLVPIARGSSPGSINDGIMACRSFLKSGGKVLIIYPEGTRSLDEKIGTFKQGAAILARDLDIPIVPAFISGSFRSLPKGTYLPRPQKLTVKFGEPLVVSDWLAGPDKHERKTIFNAYRDATAELERRVRNLASLKDNM